MNLYLLTTYPKNNFCGAYFSNDITKVLRTLDPDIKFIQIGANSYKGKNLSKKGDYQLFKYEPKTLESY